MNRMLVQSLKTVRIAQLLKSTFGKLPPLHCPLISGGTEMPKELVWLTLARLQQPTGLWSFNTGITAFFFFFLAIVFSFVLRCNRPARRVNLHNPIQFTDTRNDQWFMEIHEPCRFLLTGGPGMPRNSQKDKCILSSHIASQVSMEACTGRSAVLLGRTVT